LVAFLVVESVVVCAGAAAAPAPAAAPDDMPVESPATVVPVLPPVAPPAPAPIDPAAEVFGIPNVSAALFDPFLHAPSDTSDAAAATIITRFTTTSSLGRRNGVVR
jgi:hypothetical protein